MPNGKIGDHPLTDIVIHNQRVYSEAADSLVRKIAALGGRGEIEDKLLLEYSELSSPDIPKLERELQLIYERLASEARRRGWESTE